MNEKSIYKDIEEATRHYYGADSDEWKFVPAASDKETAHELALMTEKFASGFDVDRITLEAMRIKSRTAIDPDNKLTAEALVNQAVQERLETAVTNIESMHARLNPDDFFEEVRNTGAYQLGVHERELGKEQ